VKVFFDTGVLAAGLATRGICGDLLETAIHEHELIVSQQVLVELKRVLSDRLHLPAKVAGAFLRLLKEDALIVESRKKPSVPIEDVDDIAIIACALESDADALVTGDKELLELRRFGELAILSPRQLWQKFAAV
jgi:putative PIN family toxin of toxin-antitoxin system